ncbi:hypothetical protein MRX96_027099 [Rhipicephalus microplus]
MSSHSGTVAKGQRRILATDSWWPLREPCMYALRFRQERSCFDDGLALSCAACVEGKGVKEGGGKPKRAELSCPGSFLRLGGLVLSSETRVVRGWGEIFVVRSECTGDPATGTGSPVKGSTRLLPEKRRRQICAGASVAAAAGAASGAPINKAAGASPFFSGVFCCRQREQTVCVQLGSVGGGGAWPPPPSRARAKRREKVPRRRPLLASLERASGPNKKGQIIHKRRSVWRAEPEQGVRDTKSQQENSASVVGREPRVSFLGACILWACCSPQLGLLCLSGACAAFFPRHTDAQNAAALVWRREDRTTVTFAA